MTTETRTLGMTVAGSAITTALLGALCDKGLLTLDEARGVLNSALKIVGTHSQNPGAYEASGIISNMMTSRFSAHR